MIRSLLILVFVIVIYYAVRTVLRSAIRSFQTDERRQRTRLQGEEMVQDPECRTYVPQSRAITRQINGKLHAFCSEACATQFEKKARA